MKPPRQDAEREENNARGAEPSRGLRSGKADPEQRQHLIVTREGVEHPELESAALRTGNEKEGEQAGQTGDNEAGPIHLAPRQTPAGERHAQRK